MHERFTLALPLCLVLLVLVGPAGVRAGELRWQAPAECPNEQEVSRELEAQIGRPLSDVQDFDFDASVQRSGSDGFALTLRMLPRSPALAPNARHVEAASCRELSGAAVVAIAMALAERDAARAQPAPAPDPTPPSPPRDEAAPSHYPLRYGAGLGALLDVGALPKAALGGELELWLGYRALRVVALGALFQAQEQRAPRGTGELRLGVGGALVCGEWQRAPLALLGCGGVELGKMFGRGSGLMQPKRGGALWNALRVELGLDVHVSRFVALVTRAGVSVPLARPEFELDGESVHEPRAVSFRAQLGLTVFFSSADRSEPVRKP